MYKILRRLLFLLSAEKAHDVSMKALMVLCSIAPVRRGLQKMLSGKKRGQPIEVFGLRFKNRVGLGAGFDKNARYLRELETLGFGFVEIGTVTPRPQGGNEKPRLFRLPKDKALINRMGFNNDGVEVIAGRLKEWRKKMNGAQKAIHEKGGLSAGLQPSHFLIGGNIGKNKDTPNEDAWKDYEQCFLTLHPYVDFFVVNVSSPNTPGLRALQEKDSLKKILTHLQQQNKKQPVQRPLLLKIAPDLTWTQLDEIIGLALEIGLDGLVATNTTISREGLQTDASILQNMGMGGLSGQPLAQRSSEVIAYLHEKAEGKIPLVGSGGIFNAQHAKEKMQAGASLVEVWTGFIYEGPLIVKRICKALA